jgi:hypothetical protein
MSRYRASNILRAITPPGNKVVPSGKRGIQDVLGEDLFMLSI